MKQMNLNGILTLIAREASWNLHRTTTKHKPGITNMMWKHIRIMISIQ